MLKYIIRIKSKQRFFDERISTKNSLPYIKCVLRLSCVTHGPIHGRFMGCTVNGFPLQILERAQREQTGSNNTLLNGHNSAGKPHRKEETQE